MAASRGLVPPEKPSTPLTQNAEYDELVGDNPGLAPVTANEEPTPEETMHFQELFADFMETLYGKSEDAAVRMLKSSPELYQGVAKASFNILKAVHERYEQKEGPVDPAILFGEGGMISTAVDEVFKLAQAIGIPASQDMDQYSAAQMEAMRLVGQEIEKRQEDDAVGEAQDLLIDMEMEAGGGHGAQPLNSEEYGRLASGSAPQAQPSPGTPEPAMDPAAAPPSVQPTVQPPSGLV